MTDPRFHRKRVKHFDSPGQAHELTFSCYRRFPLLDNDVFRSILGKAINRAVERHHYELVAYVFMPEHVHLIVFPQAEAGTISQLLFAIKKPSSFRIKQWMQEHKDSRLGKLMVRERRDKTTFRSWQEGSGYDRNIDDSAKLEVMIDYLHENPIRRNLCKTTDQWEWSSWHFYHGDESTLDGNLIVHGLTDGWD